MNEPLDDVVLTTSRLRLRTIDASETDALFALHADPVAMRYWSTPPWTERAVAARSIEDARRLRIAGSALRFGIEALDDRRLIGTCSIYNLQRTSRRADVGYLLARERWGRGFMREAFDAVLAHAFGALDLNRLEADIDPRNHASARLLERAGFRPEGYLRERWIVGDEVCDTALYGLLRRDWAAAKRPPEEGP